MNSKLTQWSWMHAFLMLTATGISLFMELPWVVPGAGAVSFGVLIWTARFQWTGKETFGLANWITTLRLGGILFLGWKAAHLAPEAMIGLGLFLVAADGVDGWMARLLNQASEFGEYFDKETDAIFLLLLSLAIVSTQRLGAWIVLAGLLRYLFVLISPFEQGAIPKEQRSVRGRLIYLLAMGALLFCFSPFPGLYVPLAVVVTLFLLLSFTEDLRWLFLRP